MKILWEYSLMWADSLRGFSGNLLRTPFLFITKWEWVNSQENLWEFSHYLLSKIYLWEFTQENLLNFLRSLSCNTRFIHTMFTHFIHTNNSFYSYHLLNFIHTIVRICSQCECFVSLFTQFLSKFSGIFSPLRKFSREDSQAE